MRRLAYDAMHLPFPIEDRENHFEWWYFDAALSNGDHLVVMYSTNDTRTAPRVPTVRLNIYSADGSAIWEMERIALENVSLSYEHLDTRLGEHFCRDNGDHFEIFTQFGPHGAHLKFYKDFPDWCIGKSPEEEAAAPLSWTVGLPQGRVEGTVEKHGVTEFVTGQGYHDHNWGRKAANVGFRNWHWGKIHLPDVSIDYSFIVPRMGDPIPFMLAFGRDGMLIDPFFQPADLKLTGTLSDAQHNAELGLDYARQISLQAETPEFSLNVQIETDHTVMSERPFAECAPGGEAVARYIGREETTITRNGVTEPFRTQSLHEVVFLLGKEDGYQNYQT